MVHPSVETALRLAMGAGARDHRAVRTTTIVSTQGAGRRLETTSVARVTITTSEGGAGGTVIKTDTQTIDGRTTIVNGTGVADEATGTCEARKIDTRVEVAKEDGVEVRHRGTVTGTVILGIGMRSGGGMIDFRCRGASHVLFAFVVRIAYCADWGDSQPRTAGPGRSVDIAAKAELESGAVEITSFAESVRLFQMLYQDLNQEKDDGTDVRWRGAAAVAAATADGRGGVWLEHQEAGTPRTQTHHTRHTRHHTTVHPSHYRTLATVPLVRFAIDPLTRLVAQLARDTALAHHARSSTIL